MSFHPRLHWSLLAATVLLALVSLTLRLAGAERSTPAAAPPATATGPSNDLVDRQPEMSPTEVISAALSITTSTASRLTGGQTGDLFIQAVNEDADTLNPILTTNPTAQSVARKLFPTLVGQDPQSGQLTPSGLAAGWQAGEDGRTYTFTLRSGINWSDGQPVTAQDVQFTYAALADEAVQSPWRASLEPIAQITALNWQTVVVTMRRADCAALQLLR